MLDDDADDRDESKRKTRNLSEKKRRDQFNLLVNELNSMISTNNRKMDKSTVLKSTISFLKNHNEITVKSRVNEIQEDWKPSFLSNEEFTHLILEALDGFIMVFTSTGKINYASESITSLLGHLPNDLLSTSVYDITYEEDRHNLFNILQNPAIASSANPKSTENEIVFTCHLKRGCLDMSEAPSYELVRFTGYFRTHGETSDLGNQYNFNVSETSTRSIFVCTGRLQTPQLIRDMSIVDSSKSEFTSRHSLEWKFLFLDHRAPPIIGYLPFEVLGTSGYDYYHFDDLDKVVTCHEALIQKGEGTSCYYRFLTKGQQWIWLQTRFYITYHQWNSKPEFVVCTHRVISYQDVIKSVKESEYGQISSITSPDNDRYYDTSNNNKYLPQNDIIYPQNTWKKRSSKSKYSVMSDVSGYKKSYSKRSHTINNSTHGSDTASISADSLASRQSSTTHQSSCSVIMHVGNCMMSQNQCTQSSQICDTTQQYQNQLTQQIVPIEQPQDIQQLQLLPDRHNLSQYQENQQYLAVPMPVPSVITFPAIQPLPVPPEIGIMITPNQAQVQEQVRLPENKIALQKKHEELKQMIRIQQEELRRVSEQLVMARYGLLPPIINVSVPFNGIPPANNINWNETHEMYTQGALPQMPQEQIVNHNNVQQNQHQVTDQNFIPMQMSQHQAQLLFSSTESNQNG